MRANTAPLAWASRKGNSDQKRIKNRIIKARISYVFFTTNSTKKLSEIIGVGIIAQQRRSMMER
jgi:hypothetical protein